MDPNIISMQANGAGRPHAWLLRLAAISEFCFSSSNSNSRARSSANARSLFLPWLRSSVQKMRMPAGGAPQRPVR